MSMWLSEILCYATSSPQIVAYKNIGLFSVQAKYPMWLVRGRRMMDYPFCFILFIYFFRWIFALIAQARVQWHDLGSLQALPPEFK